MTYEKQIAAAINARPESVAAAIALFDAGNTIPFIARYRKEATGSLDEEQLRQISEQLDRLRALDERRETVLTSVAEQGKLTPELEAQIHAAASLTALEDLYAPYRPKRRTRASVAREKGLESLALAILAQPRGGPAADELAAPYVNENVPTTGEALAGARDIIAEMISDHAGARQSLREKAAKSATLRSERIPDAADERGVYRLYYEFSAALPRLRPHQMLAVNRGEAEKVLRVSLEIPDADWLLAIRANFRPDRASPLAEQLQLAIDDSARRLLVPAIERDLRRSMTEAAEAHAIKVFAGNLRGLLTQPPLAGRTVLGVDPGIRTGCKVAVVDATGKVLETATIYPHAPRNDQDGSLKTLQALVSKHNVTLIAIGNGTASRETEQLVAKLTREMDGVHYLLTNEAGASVYSASPLARAELPGLDVSLRGAVSIGRRVQDPLAELVKIEPKSIGVGMYQHDVDQKQLAGALDGVVESVVNQVGVEVNSASPALLTHVAGIGPKLAEQIVAYRDANGPFPNRARLREVPGLGAKSFEQSAGFLRIRDGSDPLDASAIHPESYAIARAVLERAALSPDSAPSERETPLADLLRRQRLEELAAELGAGAPTLADILEQLARPGRDPREGLPPPILRSDVLSADDLQTGMELNGTVRNVVDFGVFIDIGVKHDGLLHRTQIPRGHALQVGDILPVVVLGVDKDRGRVSLGWKNELNKDERG